MAVKHLEKQVHQEEKKVYDITSIIQVLENFNAQVQAGAAPPNGSCIVHFCEYIVRELGQVQTPRDTVLIKTFREDVAKVFQYMTEICESNSDIQGDIVTGCLKVLYSLIINPAEPCEAASVVLQFFDNSQIPGAVNWLLNNYEHSSDVALTRGFKVLCKWLHSIDFTTNLHIWIIEILNGLREKQKYDLLIDLSLEVIEPLFRCLVLPIYLPKVAPVVQRILTSIRHTPVVFHRIIRFVPRWLQILKQEQFMLRHQRTIQDLVDTFAALILTFPGYDDLYRDTETALAAFSTSPNFRMVLDVPAWHAEITRSGINARVGLVNLGNTCYMNSVLQALVMTKQFSREILMSDSKTPLLLKIQQLLALLLHSTRPELTPRAVLHATRPPGFLPGYQQDSSEFLGHLLETLHEQERQSIRLKADEDVTMSEAAAAVIPLKSISHNSLIQKTFGGKICITYECMNCGEKSTNSDTFRDISLSFPDEKTEMSQNYSVQDLLDYYCSSEKLDGANQYFCEKCKRLCDGVRSIDITEAPQNLILTLKHFKYDQKYHVRAKLMHKVFHDESVALKVFTEEDYQQPAVVKYVLYAAVVHSGVSMDSGHYYTYAADQECWYKFNDSFVNKCSVEDLHNLAPPNTPYILFYRREGSAEEGAASLMAAADPLPGLEELPGHLKEFIIKDNVSYYDEVKLEAQKRKSSMNVSIVLAPKNQRDSDDEPPPSNCGGNAINSYNRFII